MLAGESLTCPGKSAKKFTLGSRSPRMPAVKASKASVGFSTVSVSAIRVASV